MINTSAFVGAGRPDASLVLALRVGESLAAMPVSRHGVTVGLATA